MGGRHHGFNFSSVYAGSACALPQVVGPPSSMGPIAHASMRSFGRYITEFISSIYAGSACALAQCVGHPTSMGQIAHASTRSFGRYIMDKKVPGAHLVHILHD